MWNKRKKFSAIIRFSSLKLLLALSVNGHAVYLSEQGIQSVSETAWEQMKAYFPISEDFSKRAQLKCIAAEIIRQLDEPFIGYNWEVELFENPAVNAFALANGKIGIYTGLYSAAKNQDELATIIGHEIAHIINKHSHKGINRKIRTEAGMAISKVAIGSYITNSQIGTINIMTEMLSTYGLDLPFERNQETEADKEGLRLMAAAGFNPLASLDVWKKMQDEKNSQNLEFFSSHPLHRNRRKVLANQLSNPLKLYIDAERRPRCTH